jgi:putative transposase
LGLSGPVPARVDAATKEGLLDLLEHALGQGWSLQRACGVLELNRGRACRWMQRRRRLQGLDDARPGGNPVHGLLDEEIIQILALFERWGPIDRSHRKLAHRGSYLGWVWVSPSSVRRVLEAHGLRLRRPKRPARSQRRPFPEWAEWRPNNIWIFDTTHFSRCGMAVVAIMDLVSRKWICEVVSVEETSTQVKLAFTRALEAEGLMPLVEERIDRPGDPGDEDLPVLLAVFDNGPQMTSGTTREFMAMCAIAQHFGRPGTPTDQAWIETLFGHIKAEYPHLLKIRDPAVLRAELAAVRAHYNGVRLHEGIGYVCPDDEHEGRGQQIRKARQAGLENSRQRRLAYHRANRDNPSMQEHGDVG